MLFTPKTWDASYYKGHGYGAYTKIRAFVTANTKEEGLGMLLSFYPETDAAHWLMDEVKLEFGVYHISDENL